MCFFGGGPPCLKKPLQYPTPKYNPNRIHTVCFQYAGRPAVHTETRALGMYKNCTKKEALKLAYEHISGKVWERWKHTQSQP